MRKQLTADRALITTAAIEIKTLTIEGKQVTMAVFRQLPYRQIVDEERMELCGIPWGHVNYFWGNLNSACLHTVWQSGQTLYRSLNEQKGPVKWGHSFFDKPVERRVGHPPTLVIADSGWNHRNLSLNERTITNEYLADINSRIAKLKYPYSENDINELLEAAIQFVQNICRESYHEDYLHCKAYNELISPLYQLDQLFIAV